MRALTLSVLFLAAASGGSKDSDTTDVPADADTDADTDSDADTDADADTDTDTDVDCYATIASVDPDPGYQLTPTDQIVVVTFDQAIAATDPWSLELVGVTGSAVLDTDGMGASFTPDAPLANDTVFTVDASVCSDSATSTFRTLPAPVDGPDLEGRAYGVPFDTLNITEPQNSAALSALLPIDFLAVQVGSYDAGTNTLSALGAVAVLEGKDPVLDCGAAIDAIDVDFDLNPYFSMGPTVLSIDAGAETIDAIDFTLLGRFNADASEIQNVQVSALIDLTGQTGLLSCSTISTVANGTCEACYVGAPTMECLVLEATAPAGFENPALDIQNICFGAGTTTP